MRRTRTDEPVLITSAPMSPDEEYDRRRKKYALLMLGRALCVVAAALTYHVSIILALGFVVGGLILPWCAVLIANDRPAKKRARRPFRGTGNERALPAGREHPVVDE
jgi:hypothetical protein